MDSNNKFRFIQGEDLIKIEDHFLQLDPRLHEEFDWATLDEVVRRAGRFSFRKIIIGLDHVKFTVLRPIDHCSVVMDYPPDEFSLQLVQSFTSQINEQNIRVCFDFLNSPQNNGIYEFETNQHMGRFEWCERTLLSNNLGRLVFDEFGPVKTTRICIKTNNTYSLMPIVKLNPPQF